MPVTFVTNDGEISFKMTHKGINVGGGDELDQKVASFLPLWVCCESNLN